MYSKAILVMTMLMVGCKESHNNLEIQWNKSAILPAEGNERNLGVAGPVAGIVKGQLLVAGGANFPEGMPWEGGKKNYQKTAYLYDIDSNGLSLRSQFTLDEGIAYPANYSSNQSIYSAGGENENGPTDQVFRYGMDSNNHLKKDTLALLPVELTNGSLVMAGQRLFFVGGENSEFVSNKIYSLDLQDLDAGWKQYLTLPYPISNAVVVSNEKDKFYIAGGRKRNQNAKSSIYDKVFEINLTTKSISAITELPKPLAAGTGVYFEDQIILFGGDDASTFHRVEEAIAKINLSTNQQEKDTLIARKNKIQVNHPGFSREIWSYDLKTGSWVEIGTTPDSSQVTTTAILTDDLFIIPSGEIRAGVRTDQILMGTLK